MPNPCVLQPLFDYNELRRAVAEDLSSSMLFSTSKRDLLRLTSLACEPFRFNISDDYVRLVKAWRKLLCMNITYDPFLMALIAPLGILTRAAGGGATFSEGCAAAVQMLNRTILLGWKAEFPTQREPWDSFIERVRRSGKPSLDQNQLGVLRSELAFLRVPCSWSMLRGRNGPGAVAGGQKATYKWFFDTRPAAVPMDFFRLNPHHVIDDPYCAAVRYGVTRALQVPKDARGPRYISCEPLEYQHVQFAVKDWLEKQVLRRYARYLNPYNTLEHTRFLEDPEFCTLDLKDASDMVSRALVWRVMPRDVAKLLFAVRSTFVSVDGHVYPLRTFAPMGSSLCFDVMQLILTAGTKALTPARLSGFHWFGDDGIVGRGAYLDTVMMIQNLGLKPNLQKCCGPRSRFRESCGEEWFWDMNERTDVRPIYLRHVKKNRKDAVSSLIASQKLARCGFNHTADTIDNHCAEAGVIRPNKWRYNSSLQRMEVKTQKISALTPTQEELDGYPGLYRWFSAQALDHSLDCWAPKTCVRDGWFDPSAAEVVEPRPLMWPTAVESRVCGNDSINGLPLKEFMTQHPTLREFMQSRECGDTAQSEATE